MTSSLVASSPSSSKQSPWGFELPPALRKSGPDFRCCGLLSPWRSNVYKREASIEGMLLRYTRTSHTVLPLLHLDNIFATFAFGSS